MDFLALCLTYELIQNPIQNSTKILIAKQIPHLSPKHERWMTWA